MSQSSDDFARIAAGGSSRVGQATTTVTVDGYVIVDGDPVGLADSAGLALDVYSLARMVSSENGSASPATLLALAEIARNKAAQRGETVTKLLTHSSKVSVADGKYSEQAAGKWASTRLDPRGRHVVAAQIAMLEGSRVFGAALDFFDPSAQDAGQQGTHTLRQTSEDYIAARAKEGLQWIGPLDGVDPYHLMVFAPASNPSTAAALQVLADGRAGGNMSIPDDAGGADNGAIVDGGDTTDNNTTAADWVADHKVELGVGVLLVTALGLALG